MKKILVVLGLLFGVVLHAQEKVFWKTSVNKISETEYELLIKATIEEGWHLYSSVEAQGELVPIPTTFIFNGEGEAFELLGSISESTPITEFDKIFETDLSFFDSTASFKQRIKVLNSDLKQVLGNVEYQACDDKLCIYRDADLAFSLDGSVVQKENKEVDQQSAALSEKLKLPIKNPELITVTSKGENGNEKTLFTIFVLGFLGGLLALLTPCVFPMIPLTVSFFTKQNSNRKKGISNAVLYGFFIILIYALLSIPFHFLDSVNPEILNNISTNVWLNIAFFLIFVFFAFSFFGFYELTLPSSWGNKMDAASGVGGVLGIFFMALTLAIVSFSCTGPILGSLLAGSLTADGGALQLTSGMMGFGTALALPFALFALFPNWLNSLPKSGGWMNTVKVVLGFLELALALKFLSNADLVEHWGLLKREVFLALWIIVFGLLALYLFGKLKFPHDGPLKKLSFSRIASGILVLAFVIYLAPGLMKKPIWNQNALSGFPPPTFYSIYDKQTDCPLALNCFKDFEEGLAFAKQQNKPIMLDFTGWACVNCRKMEEQVWSKPRIYELIKNEYVLISLYVDDRKELEKNKQFNFELESGRVKAIETIGDKWATFQSINFKTASQPYYVLMTTDFRLLNSPEQYTDADTYYNWLKEGLSNK